MDRFSRRFKFADWPNRGIPAVAAGVYLVWNDDQFFYAGMSGRNLEDALKEGKKKYGLVTRLHSHASGRLSGDQFCVYVANRLVIPTLKTSQLDQFHDGSLTLDRLAKKYVRDHLCYQFALVSSSADAYALERECRSGSVTGTKPLLNPL